VFRIPEAQLKIKKRTTDQAPSPDDKIADAKPTAMEQVLSPDERVADTNPTIDANSTSAVLKKGFEVIKLGNLGKTIWDFIKENNPIS